MSKKVEKSLCNDIPYIFAQVKMIVHELFF